MGKPYTASVSHIGNRYRVAGCSGDKDVSVTLWHAPTTRISLNLSQIGLVRGKMR